MAPPALPATIVFTFDSLIDVAGRGVRLETIGLGFAVLATLVVAALVARTINASVADPGLFVRRPQLRADDLLFIALGIVPGAVLGGRLGYVLVHLDYYVADPQAIIDPGQGGLELAGAVIGGTISGIAIARLLDGTARRWLHVAALPVLLGIGLGKLAMVLGASGQGLPLEADWATAYVGAGPWGSLAPALPSHPAQLYEAGVALVALLVVGGLAAAGAFRGLDGRAYLLAVGLWAAGRAVVGTAWRDPAVLGPLSAGQLLAIGLAVAALAAFVGLAAVGRRGDGDAAGGSGGPFG